MLTIAIANQKGGVGKTTTAHALSAGLAIRGKRVLAIDMDPQCNLTSSTSGIKPYAATVYDVLTGVSTLKDAIRPVRRFSLLSGGPLLAGMDAILTQTGKEYRLQESLSDADVDYDYAILDTPPALGILTVNALTAADALIIPAQADAFSLGAVLQLQGTLDAIRKYTNPRLTVFGVLLTRYQTRVVLSRDVRNALSDVARAMDSKVYSTPIRECVSLREAQARGLDIFTTAPTSNAARDYGALADAVVTQTLSREDLAYVDEKDV